MRRARRFTIIELLVIILAISFLLAMLLPVLESLRDQSRRAICQNNLKNLALAAASYHASLGVFPFGVGGGGPPGPGRVPRWSTHSQLLNEIDEPSVYNALNFSRVAWLLDPVYGPPNWTALQTRIGMFLCPDDPDTSADPYQLGHTSYRGNAGTLPQNLAVGSPDGTGLNDGVFWFQSAVRLSSIRDGGVNVATADGAVRFLRDGVYPGVWKGMGTIDGGDQFPVHGNY